jgi:hypothetical protein
MGCNNSVQVDEATVKKNKEIDRDIRKDRELMGRTIKILLLGAGESGKSTFFKQMRILWMNGISENEISVYRNIIYSNVILALRTLTFAADKLGFSLQPENKERATFFTELVLGSKLYLDEKISSDVKALWADPAIQSAFKESYRFQLSDSTSYLMEHFDRISEKNYIPTTEDILHCRS